MELRNEFKSGAKRRSDTCAITGLQSLAEGRIECPEKETATAIKQVREQVGEISGRRETGQVQARAQTGEEEQENEDEAEEDLWEQEAQEGKGKSKAAKAGEESLGEETEAGEEQGLAQEDQQVEEETEPQEQQIGDVTQTGGEQLIENNTEETPPRQTIKMPKRMERLGGWQTRGQKSIQTNRRTKKKS